jgi:hypothetical protein
MSSGHTDPPAIVELHRLAELLAAPIDFEGLTASGVLCPAGDWYQVLDWGRLPEHARRKINAVGSGNRVKFMRHENWS